MPLRLWRRNDRRSLWQHPLWEGFQRAMGRKTHWVASEGAQALVIEHELPFGFKWIEVPRGPLFESVEKLEDLLDKIKEYGKKEKAIFIRLSSYQYLLAGRSKLTTTASDHHPETSLLIDLEQGEESILKQMKPKGRYNIKVAQKHGVKIGRMEDVDDFYDILKKTGGRDGFGIHPKSYYQAMLDVLGDKTQLIVAIHEGSIIAGGIFVFLDEWAIYYYGASDNNKRNLMAPYLIQWEAMKEAMRRGCKHYDFLGIAPEGAINHPWQGVTAFKKKFGGRVVHYPKAQDMPLRPFFYWLYRLYKKIR